MYIGMKKCIFLNKQIISAKFLFKSNLMIAHLFVKNLYFYNFFEN